MWSYLYTSQNQKKIFLEVFWHQRNRVVTSDIRRDKRISIYSFQKISHWALNKVFFEEKKHLKHLLKKYCIKDGCFDDVPLTIKY